MSMGVMDCRRSLIGCWVGLLGCTAVVGAIGCDSSAPSRNPGKTVHPVTVSVTYNGSPVEGARVSFSSTTEQQGASGTTNAEGIAKITTFDPEDGAIAGEHRVKVTKDEIEVLQEADPNDPTSQAKIRTNHHLPQKYGNVRTSGLTANIAEGENEFTFELKD